ncbi:hypothetical protein [Rhizobium metallidurans]|uniref:Uncharacterized protein n=1 Tax=Rhizobium metallidurans TaxID=1265931 RepID=A0A7W6CT37_9HYPH|nr:hypothetical protein [Rhizobium metallidurans]MBB3965971.1 hypothetical protein [Rhizobium metallidurans]
MKPAIFAFAILALGSSPTFAEDGCKTIGEAARSIMQSRQQNADMSGMIAMAEKQPDAEARAMVKKMVIEAYSKPGFATESNQARAVAEFSNEYQLACYKSAG